jgi:hypothetical protein
MRYENKNDGTTPPHSHVFDGVVLASSRIEIT